MFGLKDGSRYEWVDDRETEKDGEKINGRIDSWMHV